MDHHTFDIYPNPHEKAPLFINEPWIIDATIQSQISEIDLTSDNIRIYVPIDLNREAILRRLRNIKSKYGDVDWQNESNISVEVALLIHQIEIYDQVHFVRDPMKTMKQPCEQNHSAEATVLVKEFVRELEEINSLGDSFPYDTIDELRKEFDV